MALRHRSDSVSTTAAGAVLSFAETLRDHCRRRADEPLPLASVTVDDVLRLCSHTRLAPVALTVVKAMKDQAAGGGWLDISLGDFVAFAETWSDIAQLPETGRTS